MRYTKKDETPGSRKFHWEAIQHTRKNWNDVCEFLGTHLSQAERDEGFSDITFTDVEGNSITAKETDWIIAEKWPSHYRTVPADEFSRAYEPAEVTIKRIKKHHEALDKQRRDFVDKYSSR